MTEKGNLKQWILEIADGELIEGVITTNEQAPGKLLTWEEAAPLLDYDFDDDFEGYRHCDAVHAWTPTKVIATSVYDGGVGMFWLPRHPTDTVLPDLYGSM
jgi:hypothetical protein